MYEASCSNDLEIFSSASAIVAKSELIFKNNNAIISKIISHINYGGITMSTHTIDRLFNSSIPHVTYRIATTDDAAELVNIYAPFVRNTAITDEYEVPSVEEFASRIADVLTKFPYIVVLIDDKISGYAYAHAFHPRAAYSWCAEMSIYLSDDCHGMGIGRELYGIMESILNKQNIANLYSCVAYVENKDEYLTQASVHFHEHMGFKICAHLHNCGYKFNRWYDMVYMEKVIGEHVHDMPKLIPFPELKL